MRALTIPALYLACLSPAVAQTASPPDDTTIAQVHQAVGVLSNEIEQIRSVMGKHRPPSRTFSLSGAEPRQVFFQTQTLFRKCNTLAQEVAGISRQAPDPAPAEEVMPRDLLAMVNAAREQLGYVRTALNITDPAETPRLNERRDASDVMHDIIEAGYVLNAVSDSQPDWPDIYDRVLQMITYVGGVLPESDRFPPMPEFECCKMPEDVYQRLLRQMEQVRPLADSVGLDLVRISSSRRPSQGASTGTVYDLTTTMVSDIAELTLRMEGEDLSQPEYPHPPRILPSHAYQLAGVLDVQFASLR